MWEGSNPSLGPSGGGRAGTPTQAVGSMPSTGSVGRPLLLGLSCSHDVQAQGDQWQSLG